ncbi:hypothetical protein [Synechococcus sp. CCY9202]|nr:hypothetical protein [Synechococcus sp. CCY9202]MEA5424867.1 hypothetical protein [Synechococcus sp. CCY9202]
MSTAKIRITAISTLGIVLLLIQRQLFLAVSVGMALVGSGGLILRHDR